MELRRNGLLVFCRVRVILFERTIFQLRVNDDSAATVILYYHENVSSYLINMESPFESGNVHDSDML